MIMYSHAKDVEARGIALECCVGIAPTVREKIEQNPTRVTLTTHVGGGELLHA